MKVRELFSDSSHWTQQALYKLRPGFRNEDDPFQAYAYCLLGAVRVCYPDIDIRDKVLDKIYAKLGRPYIRHMSLWNDTAGRTFEEVKALVDELDI